MKNRYLSFIFIVFTFVTSCKNVEKRKNEINKITLLTGTCYGTCPVQTIEVDSSLTIKYHGMEFAKRNGYFIGKISAECWDSINLKFEKINYKELDTSYEHSVDDPPTFLIVDYLNKTKKIRGQTASLPDNVRKTYSWLINLTEKQKLTKTNDSINFEKEDIRFMLPPPPPPTPIRRKGK
jgi:hypothetical protein